MAKGLPNSERILEKSFVLMVLWRLKYAFVPKQYKVFVWKFPLISVFLEIFQFSLTEDMRKSFLIIDSIMPRGRSWLKTVYIMNFILNLNLWFFYQNGGKGAQKRTFIDLFYVNLSFSWFFSVLTNGRYEKIISYHWFYHATRKILAKNSVYQEFHTEFKFMIFLSKWREKSLKKDFYWLILR